MNLLDQILNLAVLLLWLSWRSAGLRPRAGATILSLAGTLKKTDPPTTIRAFYLLSLAGILVIRGVVYWHLGPNTNWTPALNLVAITLPFRSDHFFLTLGYSLLSFALVLGTFYAWLLLISVVNRKVPDSDPLQKLIRLHLGWLEHWPAAIKVSLPFLVALLAWGVLGPAFDRLGMIPSPVSRVHLWQQAVVLGLASVLCWKILLLLILLGHMINSYVYLGRTTVLSFATTTARNLLRGLAWVPLRAGRLDFSPLIACALVLFAAEAIRSWLTTLYLRLPL